MVPRTSGGLAPAGDLLSNGLPAQNLCKDFSCLVNLQLWAVHPSEKIGTACLLAFSITGDVLRGRIET